MLNQKLIMFNKTVSIDYVVKERKQLFLYIVNAVNLQYDTVEFRE